MQQADQVGKKWHHDAQVDGVAMAKEHHRATAVLVGQHDGGEVASWRWDAVDVIGGAGARVGVHAGAP